MKSDGPAKKSKDPKRPWVNGASGGMIVLMMVASALWMFNRPPTAVTITYGELLQILQNDDSNLRFEDVKVGPTEIRGKIVTEDPVSDGKEKPGRHVASKSFRTPRVGLERDTAELVKLLRQRVGANFRAEEEESALHGLYSVLMSFIVVFVAVGIGFLAFRWIMGGSNSPLTFGRSRHKLYAEKDLAASFADVAGADEAVAELREIVDFLKNPERYQKLGGRIPKGVLLVGPPGTGKTLLARAVAGEADVPFFHMSGSDFVEMFVGVGASRVRDLFGQAEARAPCIIFIDELDALGKTRGGSAVGGHDEREQTLNALLVEMDGFDSNRGVIIMAATNRPETLDVALLRPGRFDRQVVVDRPDLSGREAILRVHSRDVIMDPVVDLRHIARMTPGSSGADLANLVNEAALLAARKNKPAVAMPDLEEAIERSQVGLERKSRIMSDEEKQRVAYHESGHALVALALPNSDPIHKVTIIPRGVGALGYVLSRPEEDRYLVTQSEFESKIKMALGGTMAEEIIFGEISSGATNDLEKANYYARRMVKDYGMSPLGRISFPEQNSSIFLPGANGLTERPYSEETAREIDVQVRRIVDGATEEVRSILLSRRGALEAVARRLLEKETIDGAELRLMLEQHGPGPRLAPDSFPEQAVRLGSQENNGDNPAP